MNQDAQRLIGSMAQLAPVPAAAVLDVVLISAKTAASLGEQGESTYLAAVQRGEAPQPVIRQPKFTRWRLQDVLAYWKRRADEGISSGSAPQLRARAAAAAAASSAARKAAKAVQ